MLDVAITLLGVALFSCGTRTFPPTYINIPQQAGDVAFGNPNAGDVREMMSQSIAASVAAEPVGGAYEIKLPRGSTPETYAVVAFGAGGDALVPGYMPAVPLDAEGEPVEGGGEMATEPVEAPAGGSLGEFPTVEVRSVRVRSAKGEVEVVRPSNTGRRLATVYLEWEAGFGWAVDRVRPRRVDPDAQVVPIGPSNPVGAEAAPDPNPTRRRDEHEAYGNVAVPGGGAGSRGRFAGAVGSGIGAAAGTSSNADPAAGTRARAGCGGVG